MKNINYKTVKLHFTYSSVFYIKQFNEIHPNPVLGMFNPFKNKQKGFASISATNDAIMVEFDHAKSTIEFFIAKGKKGETLILFHKFKNGDLEHEKANIRLSAIKSIQK